MVVMLPWCSWLMRREVHGRLELDRRLAEARFRAVDQAAGTITALDATIKRGCCRHARETTCSNPLNPRLVRAGPISSVAPRLRERSLRMTFRRSQPSP